MKFIPVILVILLVTGCKQNTKENKSAESMETAETSTPKIDFFVGTYTGGESKGIYKYALHADGKLSNEKLMVETENPSFLAFSADKKYLLAVNEIKNEEGVGTVESYMVGKDTLKLINRSSSGGAHPCFVAVNEEGFVLTANYTGGNVGLLQLEDNGSLSDLLDVHQHEGKGTHKRQDGPHAHSVWLSPTENDVVEVDLGTNQLWFSTIDNKTKKLQPKEVKTLSMADGAGPRHMTFHPNRSRGYVFNELNSTITIVTIDDDENYTSETTVSTLPDNFTEENTGADIHISSDGKFLYASNRGHNSIAIFKVDENGSLSIVGYESGRGEGPRNFSLSPNGDFLLVANQYTENIISFKRDVESGLLTYVDEIKVPTPVCILF
ncbi:lactonase family protein [Galbibacter sp. EGI 63066]|uniref:lactonase family protein n=1 Tax=Galbibacter sp. EGI 63066 TaxID=2993559 RepID=UPI00224966AB|nr:lactonase family protein [Galbibacter sp. EGI 63066]MCX2678584.1 lactonase family protein [Galbibacter sp. EGI 63066]